MAKKYVVWDKQSNIYTPVGEILTPADWIAKYGWIGNPAAVPVVAGGLINGAFCGELSEMVSMYEKMGVVFPEEATDQEKLDLIAEYEDTPHSSGDTTESSADERIAAALEYANVLAMPDVNFDDPAV